VVILEQSSAKQTTASASPEVLALAENLRKSTNEAKTTLWIPKMTITELKTYLAKIEPCIIDGKEDIVVHDSNSNSIHPITKIHWMPNKSHIRFVIGDGPT